MRVGAGGSAAGRCTTTRTKLLLQAPVNRSLHGTSSWITLWPRRSTSRRRGLACDGDRWTGHTEEDSQTPVQSPTKTVIIGPEQPFAIIGERINPTGRKKLEAEMLAGDFSRVERDAQARGRGR
ncbi:MAG: hypothetical protein R3A10_23505 [Caldilineaceae bacterium]